MLNPQMTDQALIVLDMMDFRGKEELRRKIAAQGTMQETLMQVGQIAMALAQKYDPAIAQQLGMQLQGMAADAGMQTGNADIDPGKMAEQAAGQPSEENAIVRKARKNVQESTRPN